MMNDMYISLNDFYYEIGLDPIKIGSDIGWNIDDADKESYKIRIDILEDALRSESLNVPQIITDIRDKESAGFEKEIKRIKNGIDFSERICWSEMFYSTYDKVSMYCGGCAKHKYPEMMEEGKFPLLLSVKGPKKSNRLIETALL